ncbi:bifunctional helix-turn-helix transcriptional regulator/GNAT family N-acetyltransferase [Galbibacter sp.]|uniref:bifunctional helix-turn-helix transcriptional regulator/GNAT family N-acetyltransferase n=1 Tax=Galbibacter sp. TaxID=2918471 RepID=UPI003A91B304
MAEFFERAGKMAIGSRLRLLSQQLTDDASRLYELYGIEGFSPKWFPVFFMLFEDGEMTITQIAENIGHSQPSVTKIIKEMAKAGLVKDNLRSKDKRKNVAGLTEKGMDISDQILNDLSSDANTAVDGIIAEAGNNLWEAIAEWEYLIEQKSLLKRIQEQKKLRESKHVRIVEYQENHKSIFKSLNEEWVSTYFEMEATDYKLLDYPKENIIDKGGKILVALYKDEPLGVCALAKMDDSQYDYEMIKMAVSPKAQGKNIGYLLGLEAIRVAKELGASKLYLESNRVLKPAVNLYHKLGFADISGRPSPYKRADIQMELTL